MHSGFDYVILVEDLLAKYVVEKQIQKLSLATGKLVNVLPIGGWENVLKFQMMAYSTNTFGVGTTIFSVLDGDVKNENNIWREYSKLQKMFLPINSIEKYLYKVCTNNSCSKVKREVNDTFFNVESLDEILADYVESGDNNGKALYRRILNNLERRGITEESFIKELCEIIMRHENFSAFSSELTSRLMR